MTNIILEDIKSVVNDANINFKKLSDKTVLITGATGIIGGYCVKVLGELNKTFDYNVNIYATGRNIKKGLELERLSGVTFMPADIRFSFEIESKIKTQKIDYIIHCAAIADSAKALNEPVSVIDTELMGGRGMLDLALKKETTGFLYASSMEAYGMLDNDSVTETDMGYLDVTNPRNSYPQSKRMMETLCMCFSSQYKLNINVLRLGMTFGAGNKEYLLSSKRLYARFAQSVINKKSIELHTEGASVVSLCYLTDAVRAIFLVLLSDSNGEIYNVASTSLSIRDFAKRIATKFGVDFIVNPPPDVGSLGYYSDYKLSLNTEKIRKTGWKPQVEDVEKMYERIIQEAK